MTSSGGSPVPIGPVITLAVISADKNLITQCREVLSQLAGTRWDLQVYRHRDTAPASEVCIWDYDASTAIVSPNRAENQKIFYLVSPAHLETFRASVPSAEGNILLKPVTRAVLQAFLSSVPLTRGAAPAVGPGGSPVEVGTLSADRDELLQCLLQANLRLQEYDQERTNFIARAVHDFRAPLTALAGFCGLLAAGELGPINEQQREALQRMQHGTKRISRMASAMFDLSVGPQVNPKPEMHEADIRECIKQAVHELLPLAREKDVSLEAINILPPKAPLYFESSQIEQVLINLLDNACKFTPSGGTIEVTGSPYFWERRFLTGGAGAVKRRADPDMSPNSYRVDIKDTGPGVQPDHAARIFEEYTSYAGSRDRSGGGLGLAICRLILSRHNGGIWVDSHENGAVFSFVLPYKRGPQGNIPSPRA